MYTQEQLELMSDFEINKLVAEKEGLHNIQPYCGESYVLYEDVDMDTLMYYEESVDYCNSWADMGALVQESKISITFNPDIDVALANHAATHMIHANPLRAAAIVYLLME